MSPRLHFLLLRYAHHAVFVLGLVLTAWFWEGWQSKGIFLFLVPGLFLFLFLPPILRLFLPAFCPGCSSPVRLSEKERDHGLLEYIYRCHACTQQHHTGVFVKREDDPTQLPD